MPLVFFGLVASIRLGLRQYRAGQPPTALALVVWAIVAWAVVTVYLPMAWDRYLLPIQSGNACSAAVAVAAIWQRIAAPLCAIVRRPETWVFLISDRQLRVLLAHARLEHGEPVDAHLFAGRSRHGRHHRARSTNE